MRRAAGHARRFEGPAVAGAFASAVPERVHYSLPWPTLRAAPRSGQRRDARAFRQHGGLRGHWFLRRHSHSPRWPEAARFWTGHALRTGGPRLSVGRMSPHPAARVLRRSSRRSSPAAASQCSASRCRPVYSASMLRYGRAAAGTRPRPAIRRLPPRAVTCRWRCDSNTLRVTCHRRTGCRYSGTPAAACR